MVVEPTNNSEDSDSTAGQRLKNVLAKVPNKARLARQLGVQRSTLANWASGTLPRDLEMVRRLADALDEDFDWLVYGRGTMRKERVADLERVVEKQAKDLEDLYERMTAAEARLARLEAEGYDDSPSVAQE